MTDTTPAQALPALPPAASHGHGDDHSILPYYTAEQMFAYARAALAARDARQEPGTWKPLTEGERNQAVQSICEYGTSLVAPLYAVIEGVERVLESRNSRPPAAPAAETARLVARIESLRAWIKTASGYLLDADRPEQATEIREAAGDMEGPDLTGCMPVPMSAAPAAPAAVPADYLAGAIVVALLDESRPGALPESIVDRARQICESAEFRAIEQDEDAMKRRFLSLLDALIAERAPQPAPAAAQGQWLPIETAPKDGSEVWAFAGEQARMRWIEGDGYALWAWSDPLLSDADPSPEQPTHWKPLPPAPAAIGAPTEQQEGAE